jgi:uncharacterized damage-inducible protein DinB
LQNQEIYTPMNKEIPSFIRNLETTLSGQPWYGRAVFEILNEVEETKANIKPGGTEHSMNELLRHMNTWAEFVLGSLENRGSEEMKAIEVNDWRKIDPEVNSWEKALAEFKSIHKKIIENLSKRDDDFLKDMVPNRQYNFRFMLNGLVQHNIYHAGQVAYLKKMLG